MKTKSESVQIELSPEALAWFEMELPQAPDKPDVDELHYDPEADPEFVASYLKLEFVEELRNIMYERGLSGSELARKLGKSRQSVSQALSTADPDNFTIEKMAELVTAVGARISIKVHKPGTMVVTRPISYKRVEGEIEAPLNHWQPPTVPSDFPGGSGTFRLRAELSQSKSASPAWNKVEVEEPDEHTIAA